MTLQGHKNDKPERKKLRGSSEELRALAQRERRKKPGMGHQERRKKQIQIPAQQGRVHALPRMPHASMTSDPQEPDPRHNGTLDPVLPNS